jgi:hypothetical protein
LARKSKSSLDTVLYVEWLDHTSHGDTGWQSREALNELDVAVCKSVGFVLKETKTTITLVSSLADDVADGSVCIVKSCIRVKEKLRG